MNLAVFGVLALLAAGVSCQLAVGGRCPQPFGDFGDPSSDNCTSFFRCVDGTPHLLQCPPRHSFHVMLSACRPQAEVDCARQLKLFSAAPLDLAFSASQLLDPPSVRVADALTRLKERLEEELYFLVGAPSSKGNTHPTHPQSKPEAEMPDDVEFLPGAAEGGGRGEGDEKWEGPVMAEQVLGTPSVNPPGAAGARASPLPVAIGGGLGGNRGSQEVAWRQAASGLGRLLARLEGSGLGLPGVLSVLGGRAAGLGGLEGLSNLQGPSSPRTALVLALANNIARRNKAKTGGTSGVGMKAAGEGRARLRGQGQHKPIPLPPPDLESAFSPTGAVGVAPALGGTFPAAAGGAASPAPVAPWPPSTPSPSPAAPAAPALAPLAPVAPPVSVAPAPPVPAASALPVSAVPAPSDSASHPSEGRDKSLKIWVDVDSLDPLTPAPGAIPAPDTLRAAGPASSKDEEEQ